MKFIIISFLFVSINLYAQEGVTNTPTDTTSNHISSSDWHSENAINGTVTISKRKGEDQVIENKEYFENQIIRINSQIESINFKIEAVNNDAELKVKAIESGWFVDMEQIKGELNIQKLEIQNTLNNN